ncbi:Glutathione-dependent formaldehyde-activating GFA [Burkholderia multivorans]
MITSGSCHCGNLSFALDWREASPRIAARSCTCSFCRKHAGTWTSCPAGALEVTVKDPARVSAYAFGTRTARFHVCSTCGVVPVVTSEVDGRLYAVVNVNTFDEVDAALIAPASAASFDGEGTDERLARRKRNWIPDVVFRHLPSA